MEADVRVFLVTYRRPALLRRALRSLLAQTFTRWTCELHNDAPDDDAPASILHELAPNDPRFEYRLHQKNLGPVATFNLVFAGGPEPLAALLEDDNWWEPTFLERMVAALADRPGAALAWSNMRMWQEDAAGNWTDTQRNIWPHAANPTPVVFDAAEMIQAFDALHSNGAMVFRPDRFVSRVVPAGAPFAIIEQLRERAADGELVFVPETLANFAITHGTARGNDPVAWGQAKLLIAASFFRAIPDAIAALERIWAARAGQRPPDTDIFFHLAIALRDSRFVRFAGFATWATFIARSVLHPLRLKRTLRFREEHRETWTWLETVGRRSSRPVRTTLTTKSDSLPCTAS